MQRTIVNGCTGLSESVSVQIERCLDGSLRLMEDLDRVWSETRASNPQIDGHASLPEVRVPQYTPVSTPCNRLCSDTIPQPLPMWSLFEAVLRISLCLDHLSDCCGYARDLVCCTPCSIQRAGHHRPRNLLNRPDLTLRSCNRRRCPS